MQIGVFAKTFAGTDPETVFRACKSAGFETVQYNFACSGLGALPEAIPDTAAERIERASRQTGIAVAAVSATYNMADPDFGRRRAGRRAFASIAAQAHRLGTGLVTVCTGSLDPHDQWRHHPGNDSPGAWTDMCREFEALLDHAEAHDVTIGVEPEHGNIVNSAQKAALLLNTFPGGRIRIILDPANLLETVPAARRLATIDEALDLLGHATVLGHAKDRHEDGQVAPAGTGIVDWPHFLGGLKMSGFNGALVAHGMQADEANDVARFLRAQVRQL